MKKEGVNLLLIVYTASAKRIKMTCITDSSHRGQNQPPNPRSPPKYCSIWVYDTSSISSSDYVVSNDDKIIALSFVVFK